jgi:hypothetical protein
VAIEPNPVIPYATPDHRPSYIGAAVLCLTALGLIVLAGCFLIGILILIGETSAPQVTWTARHYLFSAVLYLLCFACAATAALLLVLGVRRAMK